MHILVVEDERIIAERLTRLLGDILGDRITHLHVAPTLAKARERLEETTPDLVFLDLNLRGRNGFELLQIAVSEPFETVVVSAHTERAMDAFQYGVLDFVGKPFDRERLQISVDRFLSRARLESSTRYLSVKQASGTVLVDLEKVAYLRGAGPYAELVLWDGQILLHGKSLDKLARLLPDHWERIHKSYVVNMKDVRQWRAHTGSRYELELKDGTQLPVGRTRYKALRAQWL